MVFVLRQRWLSRRAATLAVVAALLALASPTATAQQADSAPTFVTGGPGTVTSVPIGIPKVMHIDVDRTGTIRMVGAGGQVITIGPDGKPLLGQQLIPGSDRQWAEAVASTADGTVYLGADFTVHRIGSDGASAVVAGGGETGRAAQPGQLATTLMDVNLVAARGDAVYVGVGPYVHRLNDDGTLAAGVKVADERLPDSIAVGADGAIYFPDDNRIVKVDAAGKRTTVAGTGALHDSSVDEDGDGGPAVEAVVPNPSAVAVSDDGVVYIGDLRGVRRVDREGVIRTIMPDARPASLALDSEGNLYVTSDVSTNLQVIARPGEMEFSEPFPWLYVGIGAGVLLLAVAAGFVLIRHKGKRYYG